jgi:ketosteroid isomerase-like protein
MIDRKWAGKFVDEWLSGWNAGNLEALLQHYASDVVFRSPRIADVLGGSQAYVTGIAALADYWRTALDRAKDVHFDIREVFIGSDAITILYRNHRGQDVAETLVFDNNGKVVEGIVAHR